MIGPGLSTVATSASQPKQFLALGGSRHAHCYCLLLLCFYGGAAVLIGVNGACLSPGARWLPPPRPLSAASGVVNFKNAVSIVCFPSLWGLRMPPASPIRPDRPMRTSLLPRCITVIRDPGAGRAAAGKLVQLLGGVQGVCWGQNVCMAQQKSVTRCHQPTQMAAGAGGRADDEGKGGATLACAPP